MIASTDTDVIATRLFVTVCRRSFVHPQKQSSLQEAVTSYLSLDKTSDTATEEITGGCFQRKHRL